MPSKNNIWRNKLGVNVANTRGNPYALVEGLCC